MKIFHKVILIVLAISLLPLLATTFFVYRYTEKLLVENALRALDGLANIQQHRVESRIARLKERLDLVKSRTPMLMDIEKYYQTGDRSVLDHAISALTGAKAVLNDIRDISFLDRDGKVLISTNAFSPGQDLSHEECFVKGKNDYFLDGFALDSKGEVINYLSCPVYYQGKMLGVLIMESSFRPVMELFTDVTGMGESGELLLARRAENGDALYLMPLRFDPQAALKRRLEKQNVNTPIMQALLKKEQLMVDTKDYRRAPVLAATRYIQETGWGLVVKMDREEALASLARLKWFFGFLFGATFIPVVMVAYHVARRIVGPIVKLTGVTKEISDGDLSARSQITSNDEIGDLERYFNTMAETLSSAHLLLKQRVRERTGELVLANDTLRESRARLKEITDMLADGIMSVDLQGRITFMNPGAEHLLGWQASELMGQDIHELLHHRPDGPCVRESCVVAQTLASGAVHRLEEDCLRRKDGIFFVGKHGGGADHAGEYGAGSRNGFSGYPPAAGGAGGLGNLRGVAGPQQQGA
jgi:PAS domain S-box-containing protein